MSDETWAIEGGMFTVLCLNCDMGAGVMMPMGGRGITADELREEFDAVMDTVAAHTCPGGGA